MKATSGFICVVCLLAGFAVYKGREEHRAVTTLTSLNHQQESLVKENVSIPDQLKHTEDASVKAPQQLNSGFTKESGRPRASGTGASPADDMARRDRIAVLEGLITADRTSTFLSPSDDTRLDPWELKALSTPDVFERTCFTVMPATEGQLSTATLALIDQVNAVPAYRNSHGMMDHLLGTLKKTSELMATDNGHNPEESEMLRRLLALNLDTIKARAATITTARRETPESVEFTNQLAALVDVVRKHQGSSASYVGR